MIPACNFVSARRFIALINSTALHRLLSSGIVEFDAAMPQMLNRKYGKIVTAIIKK